MRNNIHDNRRAQLKCKLLTGTYILQANRAAFNQYSVNPTCKLCSKEHETREHFIAKCAFYETYIRKLLSIPGLPDLQIQQLQDPGFLTQLTLDAILLPVLKNIDQEQLGPLEICTREFIFKIHNQRIAGLKGIG